nr:DUF72 domain-containing protein [Flavobacterium sp. Sr18]
MFRDGTNSTLQRLPLSFYKRNPYFYVCKKTYISAVPPSAMPNGKMFFIPIIDLRQNGLNFIANISTLSKLTLHFYKLPTWRVLENWFKKSPDGFIYFVKAPKVITHIKKFLGCKPEIDQLYALCKRGLSDKLSCILFQLPSSFHYSSEKLNLIIESLTRNFKTAVEFRHQIWCSKDAYDQLAKNNIIFCSVSHPTMPSDIIANTFVGCLRLHGNPKMFYSEYSHTDLMNLNASIVNKHLFEEVFIYFNNTASATGVLNALELSRLFKY